jgi:hypothetical protein
MDVDGDRRGCTVTPAQASVEVQEASGDDLREAVRNALEAAGLTLDELREQAQRGRFGSEEARLAWFVVSSVADRVEAA